MYGRHNSRAGAHVLPEFCTCLPLSNSNDLVCGHVSKYIDESAGPSQFKEVNSCRCTQTEMNTEIVLRQVASAAPNLIDLGQATRDAL